MKCLTSNTPRHGTLDVEAIALSIARSQLPSGEIPWHPGEKSDPWDHVEAAMGLGIGGWIENARMAFEWLRKSQLSDGSWYAAYRDGRPTDRTRDANMTSYVAVGVFHHYLITRDIHFVRRMWPTILSAIPFALRLQADGGEIHWAISPEGRVDPMALLTGSSSIFMSLKCAIALSRIINRPEPQWQTAMERLETAIRNKPYRFNMTKSRYAMDWFYPILCGAVTGEEAQRRIDRLWRKFVVEGHGVRCVADAPWITTAETCELALALSAMGNDELAKIVFGWISDKCFEEGDYWCGYTFPDMTVWPENRMTWTNAVVLMAADALFQISPASRLFHHRFWHETFGSAAFPSSLEGVGS